MDATMRIAMVGHKRVPSREGGIEVVVEELAARMVIHGHTVTCYNRSGHHVSGREYDAEHLDEYRGIRLKHLPTIDRKGLAAVTSSFFGCLAAAFGPYNVVHVHAEGPAMFSWIPRLTGKWVILTIHGLDWAWDKWKGSFGSWYIRMGEKTGARCAHEIIVLNHSTQKYFLDTYGRTTHYIPNGVNPAAPVPADIIREKYGLEKDSYILYLGRMVPEKGCHYLVDAFKKLDTDKKLVIAGGSSDTHWYMDELKEQADGDERVIFTGFVDGQLREELYSNAYLFVLPSDLEGMPLCLLEAMSYGNCVITSDIEECANVIHDNGIVFRKGDVDDLAQKLTYALSHPNTVRMFKWLAAEYVCTRFPWERIVEETLTLYEKK
jgi:glycosyltransferase involved in cell wall biosynthesis